MKGCVIQPHYSFAEGEKRIHEMKLDPAPFALMKGGQKRVELRLWDEKRRKIRPGDTVLFTNTATGEILETQVVKLHLFENFEELYRSLPLLHCGYTPETVAHATPSHMERYYSAAQQRKYGVVGIELLNKEK